MPARCNKRVHAPRSAVQLFISVMALVLSGPSNHAMFTFQTGPNAALCTSAHAPPPTHSLKRLRARAHTRTLFKL